MKSSKIDGGKVYSKETLIKDLHSSFAICLQNQGKANALTF